ncbi:hypothetical protein C0991_011316 [Blastosporella zonata]|nr:hypothetical protein C0991_011316 [Blastosporella zonata]
MSHVCSRWRNTALSTPFLWSNIDVYSAKYLDCTYHYLTRSKNCPVDLRIDLWQSDKDALPSDAIIPLIDLVNKHATRWRTLLVFAAHRTTTNAILSRMKDLEAPLLERMRIVDDDAVVDPDVFLPPDQAFPSNPRILAGGTPNLIAVHTNNLYYPPPLANVTTLHLRTTSFFSSFEINSQVLSGLAAGPLSTLSIHGNFTGHWYVESVTMPNLRSLWFDNDDALAARFLTTVNLPNLESLWLKCPHYDVINMISGYHPRPSFPALKYLTLQSFDYYSSTKFAQVFPTIEALHFSYCDNFHVSFLKHTLVEDDLARWRDLHTLVFRTTRETYTGKFSKVLNDLVTERRRGNRPIQRVLLDRDALVHLGTANSIRAQTSLEELHPDNFDDPWWIISHTDTRERF